MPYRSKAMRQALAALKNLANGLEYDDYVYALRNFAVEDGETWELIDKIKAKCSLDTEVNL